ncbi:hypothetical protein [Thiosocius teredinicola]|uniref:hypothetical protein n=1 Tax=Thiosocius teredinicola TaxID=1973002 RepID=UPI0013DD95CA
MAELSHEQRKRSLEATPKATWALILLVGLAMLGGWIFLLFSPLGSAGAPF